MAGLVSRPGFLPDLDIKKSQGNMRSPMRCIKFLALLVMTMSMTMFADTYHSATFTGQLGSSPNIKSPFNSVLFGSGAVTGSFVYDDQKVPGGGTGLVNVFQSTF